MRVILEMVVLCFCDVVEIKKMVFVVVEYNGLVYLRFGRLDVEIVLDDNYDF